MEPMALGSPPSPTSPTSNFLPAFLMGDHNTSNTNQQSPAVTSPKLNRTPSYKVNPNDKNLRQKLFKETLTESPFNNYTSPGIDKSGPPKHGLFDTIDSGKEVLSPIRNSTMRNVTDQPTLTPNESFSRIGNDSLNYSYSSYLNDSRPNLSASMIANSSRLEQEKGTYWITIFGFPPSTASLALSHFANCGVIIDKKCPVQGNFIHIRYNTLHEVNRALAMNGKFIMNNVMVGVVPYYPKENKENANVTEFASPVRARSLRHSFVSPQPSNTVLQPQQLPQKSTGLVTKAMEYVFGW